MNSNGFLNHEIESENCVISFSSIDPINSNRETSMYLNSLNDIIGFDSTKCDYNCNMSTDCNVASDYSFLLGKSCITNLYQAEGSHMAMQNAQNLNELNPIPAEHPNTSSNFLENLNETTDNNNYVTFSEKVVNLEVGCNNQLSQFSNVPKKVNLYNQESNFSSNLICSEKTASEYLQLNLHKSDAFTSESNKAIRLDKNFRQNKTQHWTPVFPRNKFKQIPDFVIKHPLYTRKVIQTCQQSTPSKLETLITLSDMNSSHQDDSLVSELLEQKDLKNEINNIPLINNVSKIQKKYRRKQKLNTKPGAENLEFEVQTDNNTYLDIKFKKYNENIIHLKDPYPETELPEIKNILQRKKKICSLPKATNALPKNSNNDLKSAEQIICNPNLNSDKNTSNVIVNKNIINSESDSGDSIENINIHSLLEQKSLKCVKCNKLFKSTRFLASHLKRCDKSSTQYSVNIEDKYKSLNKKVQKHHLDNFDSKETEDDENLRNPYLHNKIRPSFMNNSTLLHSTPIYDSEGKLKLLQNKGLPNNNINVRPLTRSQSRKPPSESKS